MIEQEMNKIAIHTQVIFRPRNAMYCSYVLLFYSFLVQ